MEKVILDYTYYGEPKLNGTLLQEFLAKREEIPFIKTIKENWSENIKKKLEGFPYKNLVVVGIGGSSLGAEAILKAVLPLSFNYGDRRFLFFDNVDPERVCELSRIIEPQNTAFVVVSKSGKTVETIVNLLFLMEKFPPRDNYLVITSDTGPLKEFATKMGFPIFSIPDYLPGRYSVLSPVGLVPLYIMGIDINSLLEGAKEGIEVSSLEPLKNPALISASILFEEYQKGKNINVVISYSEHLYPLGFWYRQLFSESLGKESWGQTPVLDMGSVDQHSKLQLYLDGPDDKVYTFWRVREFRSDHQIKGASDIGEEFSGRRFSQIFKAMAFSTEEALAKSGRPTMAFELPRINERFIGQFIVILQTQVWFLSRLGGVNPFDQPGVERMKKIAREMILGKRKPGRRKTT